MNNNFPNLPIVSSILKGEDSLCDCIFNVMLSVTQSCVMDCTAGGLLFIYLNFRPSHKPQEASDTLQHCWEKKG